MDINAIIGQMRGLLEKATEGEWEAGYMYRGANRAAAVTAHGKWICETMQKLLPMEKTGDDAAFIAYAHNHLPAVLAELDRLSARCEAAKAAARKIIEYRQLPDVVGGPLIYPTFEAYDRLCDVAGVPRDYMPDDKWKEEQ